MKKLMILMVSILMISLSYANDFSLQCEWINSACLPSQTTVLYAHNEFESNDGAFSTGDVLSSPVSATYNSNFNKSLCCSSPYSNLNFSIVSDSSSCGSNSETLMYLTSNTNSRLAVQNTYNLNTDDYTHKICLQKPEGFSSIDMFINETDSDFEKLGYSCVYRTSALENGLVSACDATFAGGKKYNYTVFTRMWETQSSIKCNNDCTSKLDGRVYVACSEKIEACRNVPSACDGSLLGAWVTVDQSTGLDIQCSNPWNNFRGGYAATEILDISTQNSSCENLITKEYQVMLDNQLTTMKVLVCS